MTTWPFAYHYKLEDLESLPTLCVGQTCNLKIETATKRVWLCRCGVADGMAHENQVTVERWRKGRWVTTEEYPAA